MKVDIEANIPYKEGEYPLLGQYKEGEFKKYCIFFEPTTSFVLYSNFNDGERIGRFSTYGDEEGWYDITNFEIIERVVELSFRK